MPTAGPYTDPPNDKGPPQTKRPLSICLAPRPGLEPGTYGLTVRRSLALVRDATSSSHCPLPAVISPSARSSSWSLTDSSVADERQVRAETISQRPLCGAEVSIRGANRSDLHLGIALRHDGVPRHSVWHARRRCSFSKRQSVAVTHLVRARIGQSRKERTAQSKPAFAVLLPQEAHPSNRVPTSRNSTPIAQHKNEQLL